MQGARNPESGVATNKERLLPRRRVGEPARGVLGCTLQQACPVLDTGKDEGNDADACLPVGGGVFQQPGNPLLEKYQTYGKIVKD